MARYEITTETDRSRVSRTTGKLPTEVRVRHHARSMEHALGDLLRLEVFPTGQWNLRNARGALVASGNMAQLAPLPTGLAYQRGHADGYDEAHAEHGL